MPFPRTGVESVGIIVGKLLLVSNQLNGCFRKTGHSVSVTTLPVKRLVTERQCLLANLKADK
jgi:hypothetical protein